ncbi:MAG: PQQ-dependent sugar dehydrogenase [Janthinobacterium lividum]
MLTRFLAPRSPYCRWLAWLLVALLGLAGPVAQAQTNAQPTLPTGFNAVLVSTGIQSPTAMAFAPDGRIFVCQQGGQLRVVNNGTLVMAPFVSLTVDSNGERGLIGVAIDPNYLSNHYVYVYYTLASGANNRISRFTASGDAAVAGSEMVVLNLDPLLTATNHNGGAMHFGKDGKLYVAVGENTQREKAQNPDSYMGKLLRINPDGSVPAGNPYAVAGGSAQRQRVWSIGLRNPFTFSIQPGTGRIFVNNVGEGSWEEVNDASTGGLNFGWPTSEGYQVNAGETAPLYAYPHQSGFPDGTGCSITGGTFFNPPSTNYPVQYVGKYYYQDYCGKWINYIDPASSSPAPRNPFALNMPGDALGIDTGPDGNLYYLARNGSALWKIVYTASSSVPVITTQPVSQSVAPGTSVTFTVAAAGSAPLSYQWQKNQMDIAGATGTSCTIASPIAADAGKYRAVVTNSVKSVASNEATLTITAPNTAPTAQVLTPVAGATYVAGTTYSFSGSATDTEDGTLPASAYVWQLDLHHDTHVHDGVPFNQGAKTGTFTIPNNGEVSDNVFYRLLLTVTDAGGLKTTTYRDILPLKSTISLATSPAGLQLTLDDQPTATPLSVVSVQGVLRPIGAPSPQTLNGVSYEFVSWSNGGTQRQVLTTPATNTTYTATFRAVTTPPPAGQAVTSLTLFNADTDLPLAGYDPIPNGAVLNLATLPTKNLNIRANTNPATVGSVRFTYDGNDNYKLEGITPYAIGGDNGLTASGTPNYNAWTPAVGSHTLTVTPYTSGGGGGTAGTPVTIAFTVTNDAGGPAPGTLRDPDNPASTTTGLDYAYYEGTNWGALPAFASLTPVKTGTTTGFDLTPRQREDDFAFRYTGYVRVPADGTYTFSTASDDGSQLFIGAALVVNNDGLHGTQEKSGTIGLKAGLHAITVTFFERGGDQVLSVSYAGPSLAKTLIPASALLRAGSATTPPTTPTAGLRDPDGPASPVADLNYSYYEGLWTALPDFATLGAVRTGTAAVPDVTPRLRDDEFALRYTGYVQVPADGTYTFSTTSDDGSRLYIGSALVVDNDGLHATQEQSGSIGLKAGLHAFTVAFFERGGDQVLSVSYAGPTLAKQVIPAGAFTHAAPAAARATALSASVGATLNASVQLYPNPARDEVAISLVAPDAAEVQVAVYDALGQCVARVAQLSPGGAATLRLPTTQLAAGIYSVVVQCGAGQCVRRLAVAR